MSRSDPTTLLPALVTAVAKNVHGSSPANAKSGYGMSPDDRPPRRLKNTVNTTMSRAGWRTAQAAPSTVCLYRILTSRQQRKNKSSRYRQSSQTSTSRQPRAGSMTVCCRAGADGSAGRSVVIGAVMSPVRALDTFVVPRASVGSTELHQTLRQHFQAHQCSDPDQDHLDPCATGGPILIGRVRETDRDVRGGEAEYQVRRDHVVPRQREGPGRIPDHHGKHERPQGREILVLSPVRCVPRQPIKSDRRQEEGPEKQNPPDQPGLHESLDE